MSCLISITFFLNINFAFADVDWVSQNLNYFEKTPAAQSYLKTVSSFKIGYDANESYRPFSVSSELSNSLFQEDPDLQMGLRKTKSILWSNQLKYQLPSTLTFQLDYAKGQDNNQQPSAYENYSEPTSISASLSYDLLKGGDSSSSNLSIASTRHQLTQQYYNNLSQLTELKVSYFNLLSDIFTTECKLFAINALNQEVQTTLQAGEAQLKSKTIGYKDYLNFNDLSINYQRRRINLESQREILFSRLKSFDGELNDIIRKKMPTESNCNAFKSQNPEGTLLNLQNIKGVAKELPSVKSAQAQVAVSEVKLAGTKLDTKPSFTPFISTESSKPAFSRKPNLNSYTVGLRFTWNLPHYQGDLSTAAATEELSAANLSLNRSLLSAEAKISELYMQLNSQTTTAKILKKSIDNTKELGKVLEAQRKIGKIDSLNYTNSFISQIDSIHSYMDTLSGIAKISFELQVNSKPWGSIK